jgi:Iap family predicted aminopeptidase
MSRDGTLDVPPETLKGAAVLVTIDSGTNMYATSAIVLRARAIRLCADAGVTAMLIASDKPHRMLYTSAYAIYPRAPIPVLSVAREDALLLQRLLKTDPVRLVIDVRNDFVSGPLPERNVVAELPGSGREIVVLGAHYDSWDWGQGANDNGSGVAAVLDAARILRTLDTTPAATIRFVFFSGEEEGCLGSRAYVETHRAELDRHRALILMDGGAQAPIGFSVKGRHDLVAPLTPVLAPLEVLGAGRVLPDGEVASDDETFLAAGVAALELMTEPGEYDTNHHAISDTFDKVDPRSLAADTAALAGAALAIAQLDRAPASRLSVRETTEFLERTGLVEDVRLVYGPDWNPR